METGISHWREKSMRNLAALVTLCSAPFVDQERTRLLSDSLS
jgi:hypothetical protein